eukprot:CAMPEP_0181107562 /NCGR_PEP_ID=MMETSP1071-20121207/17155_1 /TAXON_ID=35127 /ORGANISM="Thalassiosira sp., Strain NH16" /LENGTH=342 /DNA_ID=CAMNT_0023191091 /DNA_START=266 /DNA_END=1294 /DNA_ORIENTATION=-
MNIMLPQHLQISSTDASAAADNSDPYLIDQLCFMQQQEQESCYLAADYLAPRPRRTTAVTSSDRRTMCSWSYDIVDACSIDREVACIAMAYFDRFMSTDTKRAHAALVSRREFQLAFIACLVIALKCRAGMQVDSDFVSDTICQGLYDAKEIMDMESEVLSALQWRLSGPSTHEFIRGFLELLPVMVGRDSMIAQLKSLANVQVEEAVLDYSTALRSSPSSVAYTALLAAMSKMDGNIFHLLDRLAWTHNIGMVTGLRADDIASPLVRDAGPFESISSTGMQRNGAAASSNLYKAVSLDSYCDPMPAASSIRSENDYTEPYFDVLSAASDMSPVSAMLDGRW